MNISDNALYMKQIILNDLFTEIRKNQCVLDIILKGDNNCTLSNIHINHLSQEFIDDYETDLKTVHASGKILIFRKYEYEKLLNSFLSNKYNTIINNLFLFDSKSNIEICNRLKIETDIVHNIENFKWTKHASVSKNEYHTYYKDNTPIVFLRVQEKKKIKKEIENHNGKKNKKYTWQNIFFYQLKYKNIDFHIDYDGEEIFRSIEKTCPKIDKTHLLIAFNSMNITPKNNMQNKSNEKIKHKQKIALCEFLQNRKKTFVSYNDVASMYQLQLKKVESVATDFQTKCKYYYNGQCNHFYELFVDCSVLYNDCIYKEHYLTTIEQVSLKEKKNREQTNKKITTTVNKIGMLSTASHHNNTILTKINGQNKEKQIHKIGPKDFVVKGNIFRCIHNKHIIQDIDAIVNIDDNGKRKSIKISAGYCPQCNTYFILESVYKSLKQKGIILCRISDFKTYSKSSNINDIQLAQESLLMQYGYNVSQTEGLSETMRHKILAVIIDNHFMSKSEIISYLDFFIKQRESMYTMKKAISKWEIDREFVESYRVGEYTNFGVNAIYRK